MKYTIIIPARLNSTRLPRKMLAEIGGKPIIQHTWEVANKTSASRVYIATDNVEIQQVCLGFGAEVILTPDNILNGTARVSYAAEQLGIHDYKLIVNLQGDEPFMSPIAIDAMVKAFSIKKFNTPIGTMAIKSIDPYEIFRPTNTKVVLSKTNHAMYFSRNEIPARTYKDFGSGLKHVGVYCYTVGVLKHLARLDLCKLEQIEGLEQLRWLHNDYKIYVDVTKEKLGPGIDDVNDLDEAIAWYANLSVDEPYLDKLKA